MQRFKLVGLSLVASLALTQAATAQTPVKPATQTPATSAAKPQPQHAAKHTATTHPAATNAKATGSNPTTKHKAHRRTHSKGKAKQAAGTTATQAQKPAAKPTTH